MGFKQDVTAAVNELRTRVSRLENLAGRLGYPVDSEEITTESAARTATRVGNVTGRVAEQVTQTRSTLDYRALAFGLAEIKREVIANFGHPVEVADHHRGVVDYFADVFAKADPEFNRAEFARLARR